MIIGSSKKPSAGRIAREGGGAMDAECIASSGSCRAHTSLRKPGREHDTQDRIHCGQIAHCSACPGRKYQSLCPAAQVASKHGEVGHGQKKRVSHRTSRRSWKKVKGLDAAGTMHH